MAVTFQRRRPGGEPAAMLLCGAGVYRSTHSIDQQISLGPGHPRMVIKEWACVLELGSDDDTTPPVDVAPFVLDPFESEQGFGLGPVDESSTPEGLQQDTNR